MQPNLFRSFLLLVLLFVTANTRAWADTTYIKFGTIWKYLDNGHAAPVAPGSGDWRSPSFNDASWRKGAAEFGYGANRERTAIQYGSDAGNKYITTYFRLPVNLTGITNFSTVRLNAYIDDGAVIYVNGIEVARTNINGQPVYSTLASNAEDNGNTLSAFDIPAASFSNGRNLIAVELHQSAPNSSDLAFDMELVAKQSNTANTDAGIISMAEPDIVRGPYLQMASENAITIRWTTTAPNTSRIKYGSSENLLSASIADNKNVTDHEMRITGLKPDTKYYYALGSRRSILKGSYRNYFTTAPPATTKRIIRIGVFGDPGTGSAVQKSSRDNYLKMKGGYNNAEMVIMLGDNAYNAGTEEEHNNRFFKIYNNNVFDNHVIFPVPGNHEYANDQTRAADHNIPYYNIFTVPTQAESGGLPSGTKHYYSYNYGNIHFIMLDSYGIDGGNHLYDDTATGQQAVWLKADLAANAGKHQWTIACLHHPPYTNGSHISDAERDLVAIRRKITPILERFGVDMVLAGHSHVYERSFLIKDHVGFSSSFNNGTPPGGTAVSLSSARYDGSVPSNQASADTSAANASCPYFTIDSAYKHGTVYVVAGSAGQIHANTTNTYPLFYTRNQSAGNGGESGALYLEIQDNRLDAKFVGNSGTIRDRFTIMKTVNKNNIVKTSVHKPVVLNASWIGAYNWRANEDAAPVSPGTVARSIVVIPSATGRFTYFVSDSLAPQTTCLTDTFTLQVTSTMAAVVSGFDALRQNNKVLVQWRSQPQPACDYFTVERSVNGIDYDLAMVMDAKSDNGAAARYEFIDNTPPEGTAYYRLSSTDKNTSTTILGIRTTGYAPYKNMPQDHSKQTGK